MKKRILSLALAVMTLIILSSAALASDTYPSKPIKLLCGYSAGGSSDILCRILAENLRERIGQPVVVENITGGGGWVMWNQLIKQTAADGYTFALMNTPNYNMGKYDAANPREYDLTAVDLLANHVSDYNVIAIRVDENRYTDFASLVEYAKNNVLLSGASAVGIMNDDSTIVERMNKEMGTQIQTVTTSGAKDNETFLLNRSTDILVANVSDVLTGMKGGTLKVLCVFAPERVSLIPDVPTCEELGFGKIIGSSSRGYGLPHGVDPVIREKLYNALAETIQAPETIKALEDISAETNFIGGTDYQAFLESETDTTLAIFGVEKK